MHTNVLSPQPPSSGITTNKFFLPETASEPVEPTFTTSKPSITTCPPPMVTGETANEVICVTTTTAPQRTSQRPQPSQKLAEGSPHEVIQAINLFGSSLAQRMQVLVLQLQGVDPTSFAKYYRKLGECIISLAEANELLSGETIRVIQQYLTAVENRNAMNAEQVIKKMARDKSRIYDSEFSAWAAPLKIMARSLASATSSL